MSAARSARLPVVTGRERVVRASYRSLPDVAARAVTLVPPGGALVLELSGPGVVDVGALSALAQLRLAARRARADLVLRGEDDDVRHLAELTGLCDALGLAPLGAPTEPPTDRGGTTGSAGG